MVDRRSAIWNNQRNAAGARLSCGHAKGLGFTTVDERVRAGQQSRKFEPVADRACDKSVARVPSEALKVSSLCPVSN